jgi:hypothetical protein
MFRPATNTVAALTCMPTAERPVRSMMVGAAQSEFRLCKPCKRWLQQWADGKLSSSVPFDGC